MRKNSLAVSALLAIVAITFTNCKKESDFTVTNPTAWVGEPVVIKDNQEKIRNKAYAYDFGDGTATVIGENNKVGTVNPSHVYNMPGTYVITQQINKTNKKGGKTIVGTQTVTVQMVTPTMEISSDIPNSGQTVRVTNTTDLTTNKGSIPSFELVVAGPTGFASISTQGEYYYFTPQTSGKYTIVMYAMQGEGKTMVSKEITVGGFNSTEITSMMNGKWTVNATGSFTGDFYGAGCGGTATTSTNGFSSISIFNSSTVSGVVANPAAEAGNIENPFITFNVIDANTINIVGANALWFIDGISASGSADGQYRIVTATPTNMVLEKVIKGGTGSPATCTFTDTYTINLTR